MGETTLTQEQVDKIKAEASEKAFREGMKKGKAEYAELNEKYTNSKNEIFNLKTKPAIKKAFIDNGGKEEFFDDFMGKADGIKEADAKDYGKLVKSHKKDYARYFNQEDTNNKGNFEHEPQPTNEQKTKRIAGTIYRR